MLAVAAVLLAPSLAAAADEAAPTLTASLLGLRTAITGRFQDGVAALAQAPTVLGWLAEALTGAVWTARFGHALAGVAAVLAAATAAEAIFRLALRPLRQRWRGRVAAAVLAATARLAGTAVFVFVVYAAAPLIIRSDPAARLVLIDPGLAFALALANARLAVGAIETVLDLLARLLAGQDHQRFLVGAARPARLGVYGHLLVTGLTLAGLPRAGQPLVGEVVNLVMLASAIRFSLGDGPALDRLLAGRDESEPAAASPPAIHLLVPLAAIGFYAAWLMIPGLEPGRFATAVVVTVLTALAVAGALPLLRWLLLRSMLVTGESGGVRGQLFSLVRVGLAALVLVVAAALVLGAWGVPVLDWLSTPAGHRLVAEFLLVGLTVFAALTARHLLHFAHAQMVAREQRAGDGATRVQTVLPLVRGVAEAVLLVATVLTVLGELGIDVTSLVAGAGFLGLAAGLGGQALLRDLLTGIFLVSENTLRIGDEVDISGRTGIVEA